MNELTLEEVLTLLDRVEKWSCGDNYAYSDYEGKFVGKPAEKFAWKKNVCVVRACKPVDFNASYPENMYKVQIEYNKRSVALLMGEDAKRVYDRAEQIITEKYGGREEYLKKSKINTNEMIRTKIGPKPERLPLSRRLGK